MKIFLPALIIFILAFCGLSLSIFFGRKGISGGCSSKSGKLAELSCTCGRDASDSSSCDNDIAVEVICPQDDPDKYQQLLNELEKRD
ncbi:MAG: hypothetical protein RBR22_00270 [Desulfuromonas sp.]|nr:hypothetical protein [Desulfuromonas sp.]